MAITETKNTKKSFDRKRQKIIVISVLSIVATLWLVEQSTKENKITTLTGKSKGGWWEKINYEKTIRHHADRHGLDWRLICAQINQESRFDPRAVSRAGARGLMQLMPSTAKELGVRNYYDAEQNIEGGIRYLRKMYDRFPDCDEADRIRFALASYNSGAGRVLDARAIANYERKDPTRWDDIRVSLPKLEKKYASLHWKVWGRNRPKYGYFKGHDETIQYVDRVMAYYGELKSQQAFRSN